MPDDNVIRLITRDGEPVDYPTVFPVEDLPGRNKLEVLVHNAGHAEINIDCTFEVWTADELRYAAEVLQNAADNVERVKQ